MSFHVIFVACLDFAVTFLLLLGTNSICGYSQGLRRPMLAAAFGCICCSACLLPAMYFLRGDWWRVMILGAAGCIAFGISPAGLRKVAVFLVLNLALVGMASGLHGGIGGIILVAAVVAVLYFAGVRGTAGTGKYIPVELAYGGRSMHIFALRDTGNTLRDPVTGKSVLVLGSDVAKELTGLTAEQLRNPLDAITAQLLPGLRLIPYRTVGQPCGMLLALHIPQTRIGGYRGSSVVAFAPNIISADGTYQALTGGTL